MLQHPQFTLSILDPSSLLGTEVVEALWHAFPSARRRFFHSGTGDEHLIAEVAGEAAIVPPIADAQELDGSDLVIATESPAPAAAEALLTWLRANPRVYLVDCSQPGIAPTECEPVMDAPPPGRHERRWLHLADPALWPVARVLQALAPLAPVEALVTALLPVSGVGAAGVEELAAQAAARLSGRPPKRPEALDGVLAFDAAPAGAARHEELSRQLRALFPSVRTHLHALQVGIFHGNAATLDVRTDPAARQSEVASLLRSRPGVRLARRNERLQPSGAVEKPEVVCGELECAGEWTSMWLVADGLRVGGAQAVADIVAAITAS